MTPSRWTPAPDDRLSPRLALAELGVAHRPALATADADWTFAQLHTQAEALALRLGLDALPVAARVAFAAPNTPQSVALLWALLDRGLCAIPLHPRWTDAERAVRLTHVTPHLTLDAALDVVGRDPQAPDSPWDAAALMFTSGTSGRPKAAILTRRNLQAAAHASAVHLGTADDDAWLLAMPLAHVGGLSIVTRMLADRRKVALLPRFDVTAVLEQVAAGRVTLLSVVPAMLHDLLAADTGNLLSRLRILLVGGDRCPPRLLAEAWARGWPALPTYGLTETCAQAATARPQDPSGGACALPGVELAVLDDAGLPVATGETGEVAVRGPSLCAGYWAQRESHVDARGFFHTGDVGLLDGAGRLTVVGRRSDRLISGGENVAPAEVEAVLRACPGVADAAVVGVPDERWGEVVAALVVAMPGTQLDFQTVAAHIADRLAVHARPRKWAQALELPRNSGGKVDRGAVRRCFG
ncbi:MAG: class I adenylate-forming enzyme family protein [Myxococcota bacterium]